MITPVCQWPALAALIIILVGCNKEAPDRNKIGAAPAMVNTGAPLTEDDGREFGNNLEQAVAAGDTDKITQLLRLSEMLERSVSDMGLSTAEKRGFLKGSARFGSELPALLIKIVEEGGSYSLLRVRMVAGRPRVIVRLIQGEGAINYHEFTIVRYPDQQIATEDFYVYASGEPISQTCRRIILSYLVEKNSGVANLNSEDQLLIKHFADIRKIPTMLQNGQYKTALELFRKLPAELQKMKHLQLYAIKAAGRVGDDNDYIKEMERFRKNHPKDVAVDFISMDYYMLKEDYDETLNAITRLDDSLGGDPFLNVMRASILIKTGKFKEARAHADRAIKEVPKLPQAYWSRVEVAAREKDHDDTLNSLKLLVENVAPTLDPDALAADDRFADFAATPQFEEFKKWLAQREP